MLMLRYVVMLMHVPLKKTALKPVYLRMYSVFTINVPLVVRFATISIGTRKAESPEYGRFDRDLQ